MRVLHVIPEIRASAGGVSSAVSGLAIAQQRAGMDVSVLAPYIGEPDQPSIDSLTSAGVRVHTCGPVTGRFGRHPNLKSVTETAVADADIVHIAALWEEVQHLAARAAKRQNIPYLISPHGMLDPWSLSLSKWVKRVVLAWRVRKNLNEAAALHFTCAVERDLVASLKLKPSSIVEPNGLDLSEFENLPSPDQFRSRYPSLANDRPIVLFLSRLHPKKGLDLLIPAFTAGPKEAMLVIAGPDSDDYQKTVEAMIRQHNIQDRVIFTGMLKGKERVDAMAAATIFVLPSYQENFGIVVAESLAAGVPVIISDQVNIHAEITAAGVGGVVPTKVEPLARELARWLEDNNLRSQAALKCRPFAQSQYDWNKIAERWKAHYSLVMK